MPLLPKLFPGVNVGLKGLIAVVFATGDIVTLEPLLFILVMVLSLNSTLLEFCFSNYRGELKKLSVSYVNPFKRRAFLEDDLSKVVCDVYYFAFGGKFIGWGGQCPT